MPKPPRLVAGWLVLRMTFAPTFEPAAWADPNRAVGPVHSAVAPVRGSQCLIPGAERSPEADYEDATLLPKLPSIAPLATSNAAPAAWRTLVDAGISPSGIDPDSRSTLLVRLQESGSLRRAFREALGDSMADGLERILRRDRSTWPHALVIGNSVILPNLTDAASRRFTSSQTVQPAADRPQIVSLAEYAEQVAYQFERLEEDRSRYQASVAQVGRAMSSVRNFVRSLRHPGRPDDHTAALRLQAAEDYAALQARLATLRLELGVDPSLGQIAQDKVAEAARFGRECEQVAARHRRWIQWGAGGVVGLIGASGLVIASGATGTMGGGLVIAAAIEASLGAYLMYRTERTGLAELDEESPGKPEPRLPEEAEKRRFAVEGDTELSRGRSGDGRGEQEVEYEAEGGDDWSGGEGEGEPDEGELEEATEPRENHVPPILPTKLPDELLELPPLLDPDQVRELQSLSLAEIQKRLDEFLALENPPAMLRMQKPAQPLAPSTVQQLIEEAKAALQLWKERRQLSEGFGEFFLRAELEEVPADRRPEAFAQSSSRFASDQQIYRSSADLDDLRKRIATRLVTHCRAAGARGDLIQASCTDETALAILVVSAVQHSGVTLPGGSVLGVQARGSSFHPVLFFPASREVLSLTSGDRVRGVVGPLYHPASFYFSFLVEHGVRPDIDPERHLLIAPADPGMEPPATQCAERRSRGVVGRVVDWFRSLVGVGIPSRRGSHCPGSLAGSPDEEDRAGASDADGKGGEGSGGAGRASSDGASEAPERRGVSITISGPRIPSPRGGGGPPGGGGQGGGGSGGGKSGGQPGGGGQSGGSGGSSGGGSGDQGGGAQSGGAGKGAATGKGAGGSGQGGESGRGGAGSQGGGATGTGERGYVTAGAGNASGDAEGVGSGGDGEGASGAGGMTPDLNEVARQTVAMRRKHQSAEPLRVRPWRLRADYGYVAPSARVLFADNEQALSRFDPGERFITLSPSEDEEQRRMQEADSFPVFAAGTGCDADDLPPRRVFRRAAGGEPGFRYVFCDQDESTVIFRTRDEARAYATLGGPDRPLYLVRLAAETLGRLERSAEIARIRAFLDDPNVLREFTTTEVDSMVKAAGTLLIFQQTLESALVQSMEELEGGAVRAHYYDMHRQVLQAPLFVTMAEASYRLNRRLASDPLQALSWANALPPETRQHFFRLYNLFGAPVRWPERWQVLAQRYGAITTQAPSARTDPQTSLDFLQILSDPTRVQIDWQAEPRASRPSIRDRRFQKGKERTPEQRPHPSEADKQELQDRTERAKGGTRGKGKTGQGDGIGPEKGRQPLQMISIRMVPEDGDPDRPKVPANNRTRPGGTKGQKKSAEESATRQEPILWVAPHTFVDAVLSTWDRRIPAPEAADRVPPVLRLNSRLREIFLRDMDRKEIYDGRLIAMMGTFTSGGWLRYQEVRSAMGGPLVRVRAVDTGRFAAKYARTAPINDQDQIRMPNFFAASGVILPADLFEPLRKRYAPAASAIFDLTAEAEAGDPLQLRALPHPSGDSQGAGRAQLLRSLEVIREQSR